LIVDPSADQRCPLLRRSHAPQARPSRIMCLRFRQCRQLSASPARSRIFRGERSRLARLVHGCHELIAQRQVGAVTKAFAIRARTYGPGAQLCAQTGFARPFGFTGFGDDRLSWLRGTKSGGSAASGLRNLQDPADFGQRGGTAVQAKAEVTSISDCRRTGLGRLRQQCARARLA
jgi:hypothetical protein